MSKNKKQEPKIDFRKMYQLAEHYSQASNLLFEQAKGNEWGCSAPRLLVDSFAVELYLKCLYVMDTNRIPLKEHDWEKLFNSLNRYTQIAIQEAFERIVSSNPVLSHLDIINPDAFKTTDFKRSLKAAKNTFDSRRYLYEAQPEGEWFYTHLLRKAITNVANMDVRLAETTNIL